ISTYSNTSGCNYSSSRVPIKAIINPIHSGPTSGGDKSRCGTGTVTLTATPGSNGNTIRWYSAATGGTLLHTGTSYTPQTLSATSPYYAASYNSSTGCQSTSARVPIKAIINPIPSG